MHSYTFNSKTEQFERGIPNQPWGRIGLFVLVVVCLGVAGWEMYWRGQGYEPSYDGTESSWAEFRAKAQHAGPEYTIMVGSSRALFDVDMPTWRQEMGNEHLIQLSKEGTGALPVLRDIIEKTDFSGTLVVSVTPGLFFAKGRLHDEWAETLVKYYHKWSPAQKMEHQANLLVEPVFAFAEKGELNLAYLLPRLPLPNRPDVLFEADGVPKLSNGTRERQAKMWNKVATDSAYALRARRIWLGFASRNGPLMRADAYAASTDETMSGKFKPPPPHVLMTQGEKDSFFMQIRTWADTFRKRGGQMIFIRPPSSGMLLELEKVAFPRAGTWDVLLERTGVPGVHFEDYPELQGFELPEWSHLRAEHSPPFTRALARIVKEKLKE
jgi:hypothetical protein